MWAARYWSPRYWARRFWAKGGVVTVVTVTLETLASTILHKREIFTADGITKDFTVTDYPIRVNSEKVFLSDGLLQSLYTIANSRTVSFTLAPPAGKVVVYFDQEFVNTGKLEPSSWPTNQPVRLGAVHRREQFTLDSSGIVTLIGPIDGSKECVFAGEYQQDRDVHYTVAGDRKTITFSDPKPPSGTKVTIYYLEAAS